MPKNNKDFINAVHSHPRGRGLKPAFEALWHLEELNVVEDLDEFSSTAWDAAEGAKPPVVVVMDTPMDIHHPNLERNIDRARMRDFSVHNEGAFPIEFAALSPDEKTERSAVATALQSALESYQEKGGEDVDPDYLLSAIASAVKTEVMVGELGEETCHVQSRPRHILVNQLPGAHGTAVAGLVAGVPATKSLQTAAYLGANSEPSTTLQAELPYAGINPFATIVPISLTAAPYPDMVLGALTYIEAIKPDIIVVAAAWADTVDLKGAPLEDSSWPIALREHSASFTHRAQATDEQSAAEDKDVWAAVTQKIKSLSRSSIVLCAAGNVESDQLVYPASLCADKDNQVWAVTACDTEGVKLSYAPRLRTDIRMIQTLSSQLPRSDHSETVVDPYESVPSELQVNHLAPTEMSARDIITLDPGGSQGYNPTEYPVSNKDAEEPLLEIGSLYTRFSGTSAATAIAGGLVSLALSLNNEKPVNTPLNTEQLFDLDQARALFGKTVPT